MRIKALSVQFKKRWHGDEQREHTWRLRTTGHPICRGRRSTRLFGTPGRGHIGRRFRLGTTAQSWKRLLRPHIKSRGFRGLSRLRLRGGSSVGGGIFGGAETSIWRSGLYRRRRRRMLNVVLIGDIFHRHFMSLIARVLLGEESRRRLRGRLPAVRDQTVCFSRHYDRSQPSQEGYRVVARQSKTNQPQGARLT